MIFPYLLDLLFESLVNTIQDLTYDQIKFEYWDYKMTQGVEPYFDLFGPIEGESYLKKLCKYIRQYYRCHSADAPLEFQELLSTGSIAFKGK